MLSILGLLILSCAGRIPFGQAYKNANQPPVPTSTDWPCHVETSQQLSDCFRMEREKVTFPCAKEIVVQDCQDALPLSLENSRQTGDSTPLTSSPPLEGGVFLHSSPRNLSGIRARGGSVRETTKSQIIPKTKVAPAVLKRKIIDDSPDPYDCEEVLVQKEEECITAVEQEVCTDYEEEVDDTCFKTVPKEKYICPEFVLMRVCDFTHVYPVAEVPDVAVTNSGQPNDMARLLEESSTPQTKEASPAEGPDAGKRRLFIQT
ncbi:conserved hypothetical protein [Neospora caninum Liverpool]|nr:conserved hypothetical protein [Neospora caninum Liverpool]CBZ52735.1 conserved hypothetical protein [Neospora caninum Liverpool]|eukprot:XP_003882767.1 conserved hypothetical protein [Neospora caninum Liverpool]